VNNLNKIDVVNILKIPNRNKVRKWSMNSLNSVPFLFHRMSIIDEIFKMNDDMTYKNNTRGHDIFGGMYLINLLICLPTHMYSPANQFYFSNVGNPDYVGKLLNIYDIYYAPWLKNEEYYLVDLESKDYRKGMIYSGPTPNEITDTQKLTAKIKKCLK
jgi:hypothetical protein